jgi:hypothetical protein
MEGNTIFEKINFQQERIDFLENPLLGPYLRRKHLLPADEIMTKKASQIAIYYLNMHKRYDLDVNKHQTVNPDFRTTFITNLFQAWTGSELFSSRSCITRV